MHIKITTAHTKKKTYVYVKVVKSTWNGYRGAGEEVIATLGTLEEVLKSKDVLLKGLSDLKDPESYRQRKPAGSARARARIRRSSYRQKGSKSI